MDSGAPKGLWENTCYLPLFRTLFLSLSLSPSLSRSVSLHNAPARSQTESATNLQRTSKEPTRTHNAAKAQLALRRSDILQVVSSIPTGRIRRRTHLPVSLMVALALSRPSARALASNPASPIPSPLRGATLPPRTPDQRFECYLRLPAHVQRASLHMLPPTGAQTRRQVATVSAAAAAAPPAAAAAHADLTNMWTHLGLNPWPSAREPDVIPLSHLPT